MGRMDRIAEKVVAGGMTLGELQAEISSIARAAPPSEDPAHADAVASAVKVCKEFVRANIALSRGSPGTPRLRTPSVLKWGFDLTDMRSAAAWANVLRVAGVNNEPVRTAQGWVWKGSGMVIVTGNNPVTGEYYRDGLRQNEVGYASSIGVEGNPDRVMLVVKAIRKNALYIKDESPKVRDFI